MATESIRKFELVLAGVGFTDVFFDYDFFLRKDFELSYIRELLLKTSLTLENDSYVNWYDSSENEEIDKVLKSKSSYKLMTKREELISCKISDFIAKLNDLEEIAPKTYNAYDIGRISKSISQDIFLTDIHAKFFLYGNSIIRGTFGFKDIDISFSEYSYLSDFLHSAFGEVLRPIYEKVIQLYKNSINSCFKDSNLENLLLRIPVIDSSSSIQQPEALTFSIRYHFIYNSSLRKNFDTNLPQLKMILNGEWEQQFEDIIYNNDATIYLGWSESLFIFDDECTLEQYLKYSLPLEVVLANWASLKLLSKKIDKAIAFSSSAAVGIKNRKQSKINYHMKMNEINEFSMKLDRVIEYYSSYSVSNNPTNFVLIEKQLKVFLQDSKIIEIQSKMELLSKIIERLSGLQKNVENHRLNTTLLALTLMSIIGNSYTIFQIVSHKPSIEIPIIVAILLGVITIIQLYAVISRKRMTKK